MKCVQLFTRGSLFFLLMGVCSAALACPTCKDAMGSDPAQAGLAQGLYWSILFMMSMPFVLLASVGGYMYWTVKQHEANRARLALSESPTQNTLISREDAESQRKIE